MGQREVLTVHEFVPVVPYKALENFPKALYGTTGGTYSARVFRPVIRYWTLASGFVLLSSGHSIK